MQDMRCEISYRSSVAVVNYSVFFLLTSVTVDVGCVCGFHFFSSKQQPSICGSFQLFSKRPPNSAGLSNKCRRFIHLTHA